MLEDSPHLRHGLRATHAVHVGALPLMAVYNCSKDYIDLHAVSLVATHPPAPSRWRGRRRARRRTPRPRGAAPHQSPPSPETRSRTVGSGAKEMSNRCLIYLHAISLGTRSRTWSTRSPARAKEMLQPMPNAACTCHLFCPVHLATLSKFSSPTCRLFGPAHGWSI